MAIGCRLAHDLSSKSVPGTAQCPLTGGTGGAGGLVDLVCLAGRERPRDVGMDGR